MGHRPIRLVGLYDARPRLGPGALVAVALVALLGAAWPRDASAHSLRVAYVQITALPSGELEVVLKSPLLSGGIADLSLATPSHCARHEAAPRRVVRDGLIERWRLRCEGAPSGELEVLGLGGGVEDAIVSWEDTDGASRTTLIAAGAATVPLWSDPSSDDGGENGAGAGGAAARPSAAPYLTLGIAHILGGPDHLLFVLGLLVVVRRRAVTRGERAFAREMVGTVTAFTLAHSLTLALSALGVVGLPSGPVELTIALSILLLAVELARNGERAQTLTFRFPWAVAFAFGLLHGFGFAGALAEIGLPEGSAALALFLFNLGVELGQLAFVAVALAPLALVQRMSLSGGRSAVVARLATSYAIGIAAAYWCVSRAADLWL